MPPPLFASRVKDNESVVVIAETAERAVLNPRAPPELPPASANAPAAKLPPPRPPPFAVADPKIVSPPLTAAETLSTPAAPPAPTVTEIAEFAETE